MSEKREPWIDAARGLLIILVVLGHAFGTACHLASDRGAAHIAQMIYKSIYMFHMPAFFVLAGVTLSAGRDGFLRYLQKKALRLLIPYFVFGLMSIALYFVCQVLGIGLGSSSNGYYGAGACNSLASELLRLVRGDACSLNSPLWFLPCMFVVEVLYCWLSRFLPSKKWCQVWVALVMLLTSYALIGVCVPFLPEWWTRVPMFVAMLMIGRLVVGKRGFALFKGPKIGMRTLVALGGIAYFAICWNLPWGAECRGVLAYLGYRALAIVGAVVVFILSQNFVKDGLCYVGFSSMGILVLHKLPLATLQLKVNFISQLEGLLAVLVIFCLCLMTTALCVVLTNLIKRFAPIVFGEFKYVRSGSFLAAYNAHKMKPLVSIVIANYNYGRFIDEAIQSVLSQSCQDFELIIVDGGSTDDSVEVIRKYQNRIAWWCSEPDKGQSDAFNKGFSHATGRFLAWLNADDVMLPRTIAQLKIAAERYPEQEWFVGGCFWLDPEMRVFRCGRARHMSCIRAEHGLVNVCGPSSFFTKDLYLRAGKIDERNHYTMDTDLWLRFALNEKVAYRPFIRYAWGLRLHPAAKMSGHKFTADGKILSGEASDAAFLRDQKRMQQLQLEQKLTLSKIPPLKGTMSRWMQLATADWLPAVMSRWDTFRYGGKKLSLVIHKGR